MATPESSAYAPSRAAAAVPAEPTPAARTPAPARSLGRVPELDLLRFLAAASVVVYHYTYRVSDPLAAGFAFPALEPVTRYGYLGVTLFFMISGFVILWSSQKRSAGEFVVSRVARLYPSLWICALLTALVVNMSGAAEPISARTFLANLTMVPALFGAPYVDGVYWTLFVELKFYVLVYVVLLSGTMARMEWWLAAWLAASAICAAGVAPRGLAALALYPYGPYFISGCLFYLIRSRGLSVFRVLGILIACALGARYAVAQQPDFMKDLTPLTGAVTASAVVLFHVVFAAIALRPGILPSWRYWYVLGSLTYPLYLLHARIGKEIWAGAGANVGRAPWAWLALELTVALVLSSIVAAVTERRGCAAVHRALMRACIHLRVVRPARVGGGGGAGAGAAA